MTTAIVPCIDAFEQALLNDDRSEHTRAGYVNDLHDFRGWFELTNAETFGPTAITPTDVREYRQHLLVVRKLKPATINRRLASLASFARWAIETEQIETDPTARIRPIEQVPGGPHWLDRKQRFALQRAIEKESQTAASQQERRRSLWRTRNATLMSLMLNTGLRVAEVSGLDIEAVEVKPRSGRVVVRGKGNKVRTVPLNAEARDAAGRWLTLRPNDDCRAFFVSQALTRMTTRSIERVVADYGHLARLEKLTPHVLRHTFAKTLMDRGIPIDQVAQLLGHANLNTTRVYTTPGQRDLERAVEAMAD